MSVTTADLADQILDKTRAGGFLLCPDCGAEYSASTGDYWNLPADYVFTCANDHAKIDMILATKSTSYKVVKQ